MENKKNDLKKPKEDIKVEKGQPTFLQAMKIIVKPSDKKKK